MDDAPRIIYRARGDATAESELDALASAYRFILDCRKCEKAAETAPDDTKKEFERKWLCRTKK